MAKAKAKKPKKVKTYEELRKELDKRLENPDLTVPEKRKMVMEFLNEHQK